MTVTVSPATLYTVTHGAQTTVFVLDEWEPSPNAGATPRYGGQMLVYSPLAQFCHSFGSDVPFKAFLADLTLDDFLACFAGTPFMEFDGRASLARVEQRVQELQLESSRVNAILASLKRNPDPDLLSETDFLSVLSVMAHYAPELGSPTDFHCYRPSEDLQAFWNEVWPEFIAALHPAPEPETA